MMKKKIWWRARWAGNNVVEAIFYRPQLKTLSETEQIDIFRIFCWL